MSCRYRRKRKELEVVPVHPRARFLPVDTPPPLEECYHARISIETDHGLRADFSSEIPIAAADPARCHAQRQSIRDQSACLGRPFLSIQSLEEYDGLDVGLKFSPFASCPNGFAIACNHPYAKGVAISSNSRSRSIAHVELLQPWI